MTEKEAIRALVESAKVEIELLEGRGNLLAVASVKTLNDVLEINGWRISKSKFSEDLWVQPPCFKENKEDQKYHKAFWINDKEIESLVKTKIITAYDQALFVKDYENEGF